MLLHDVRIGFRLIRRAPLLHLAVVLILAVGIGLNSVVFSFFNGLLFRPNVTHDPTSFVRIYAERSGTSRPDALGVPTMMTLEEWEALRTGSKTLTAVTASKWATFPISDGVAANLRGLFVSCDFFRVHAPQTLVGRTFEESDCAAPGSAPLAILSERAWNSFFNRDPAIVGRSLIVYNHRITIIGVVADYAVGDPEVRMMFVPHTMYAALQGPADVFRTGPDRYAWLNLSGRLAAGHTAADAQRELRAILGRLEQLHPGRSTQARVTNGALIDEPGRARTIVALVIAAAMLVLLLVCANVATLLLSRAEARRREMGIRTALGASHRRLLTQLSIEGALPALAAAGLSLALAFLLPGRLAQLLAGFPVGISLAPDLRVLAYTLLIALVAGIVAALWSVLPSVRLGAWGGVEVQSRIDWQVRPPTRRDNLIAQQLAASLALLVAIGLVWRAQHVLANPDLPYDAERILVASFDLTRLGYSPARAAGLYSEVLTRLDNLPTVRTMAASTHPPFRGVLPSQISIETDDRRALPVSVRAVSPDYFALLGIRTIDGRLFSEEEAQSGPDPLPVVVSEALMRGISGDTQLLRGRRVTLPHGASAVIVGVVADTSTVRVSDLDGPVLYQPMSAAGRWSRAGSGWGSWPWPHR